MPTCISAYIILTLTIAHQRVWSSLNQPFYSCGSPSLNVKTKLIDKWNKFIRTLKQTSKNKQYKTKLN